MKKKINIIGLIFKIAATGYLIYECIMYKLDFDLLWVAYIIYGLFVLALWLPTHKYVKKTKKKVVKKVEQKG